MSMIFPTFTMHLCTVHYDTDTDLHQVQYIYVFVVRRYSDVAIYRYRQCTALTECPWFLGGIGICFLWVDVAGGMFSRSFNRLLMSSYTVSLVFMIFCRDFHKMKRTNGFGTGPSYANLLISFMSTSTFMFFVKKSKTKLSSFSPALYGILETFRFVYVCTVQDHMILWFLFNTPLFWIF